ncbi:hypothetical protein HOK51_04845 [Candidatus Woesearchaeota archaeon]|jgi:hypothetical protein|nr:hypothetical protein [Candidatus Woesearchaeota archaeon]MBT7367796.1 hypothetical protein [Candidatus Woesearchaeota archaeon]
MNYKQPAQDCLVLWCVEGFELGCNIDGLSLLNRRISKYDFGEEEKPVFYAPSDSRSLAKSYGNCKDSVHLVAQGECGQNSVWQLEQIANSMEQKGLKTAEVIGFLPGCINIAGDELSRKGFTTTVLHTDGRIMEYKPVS